MTTHYEDLEIGETAEFGTYDVTKSEILEFGRAYDPQPMHVDEDAAADSMFGELVASGWHTAAMSMRLLVDGILGDSAAMGAPGVEELRWPEPVRPGDELRVETEIEAKRPSESDPRRGIVTVGVRTKNQADTTVMSMTSQVFWARREAGD